MQMSFICWTAEKKHNFYSSLRKIKKYNCWYQRNCRTATLTARLVCGKRVVRLLHLQKQVKTIEELDTSENPVHWHFIIPIEWPINVVVRTVILDKSDTIQRNNPLKLKQLKKKTIRTCFIWTGSYTVPVQPCTSYVTRPVTKIHCIPPWQRSNTVIYLVAHLINYHKLQAIKLASSNDFGPIVSLYLFVTKQHKL